MKMKNKKRCFSALFRLVVGAFLCVMVAVVPTIYVGIKLRIEDKYSAKRSDYQGILEIWNIDTFEGGTAGKNSFLKAQAIEFEKQNQGLYFMVKNMTETQCMLALSSGRMPAIFSFGAGIGEQILEYLQEIDVSSNIRTEFLDAGKKDGKQYAYAWCRGVYSLISTQDKLKKTSNDTSDLASVVNSCGYVTKLKNNKTKTTYSLAFGSSGYVCPQLSYASSYTNLVQTQTSIDINNLTKTPYTAYCDFIENRASILLGTQRDIARIENRINAGKIEDVVYQHLVEYTDLVQFLGVCHSLDAKQTKACETFINFLLTEQTQSKLSNIGMFSVNSQTIYSTGVWQQMDVLSQNKCRVQNAFTTKSVIESNKQSCIECEQI